MKKLLYIGNKLSLNNATVTTIETLSKNLINEGYSVIAVSGKKNKYLRLLDMMWHIVKLKHKIDVVLIDTYSTKNFYFAYLCSQMCRFFKLSYIPILHGGNLPNRLKNSKKKSHQIFSNAKINVAPSLYLKSSFQKFGFKNVVYIPNAIELKNYKFNNRELKTPKLLWVRSFSKIYNPFLAIQVLSTLKAQNIAATLCMVGPEKDGSLKKTIALAKQLGVEVEFTGKLSKQDWCIKAKKYNIFINTTNVDNTPVSVIEAMALGLPVISTNVGGLPYLIKNNRDGILVPANNAQAFYDAIGRLLNNSIETKTIIMAARRKVEDFDWDKVKHKWFSILSK